jgi:hypothetical protein
MTAIHPWDFSNPNETIRDRRNPRSFDPDAHMDHANTETGRAMVPRCLSGPLSHQPFLLLTTCLTARLGFNKFNGLVRRQARRGSLFLPDVTMPQPFSNAVHTP